MPLLPAEFSTRTSIAITRAPTFQPNCSHYLSIGQQELPVMCAVPLIAFGLCQGYGGLHNLVSLLCGSLCRYVMSVEIFMEVLEPGFTSFCGVV